MSTQSNNIQTEFTIKTGTLTFTSLYEAPTVQVKPFHAATFIKTEVIGICSFPNLNQNERLTIYPNSDLFGFSVSMLFHASRGKHVLYVLILLLYTSKVVGIRIINKRSVKYVR
jgi:hypothetical protein